MLTQQLHFVAFESHETGDIPMTASVSHTIIDNSGEQSVVKFYLPDVTAVNYDTITGNGKGDNVGDLRLAVAAI